MAGASWRDRADEQFVVNMPSRGRVALEMALLLAVVFAANAFVVSLLTAALVTGLVLALALALVRPWAPVHGSIASRALAFVVVVLAVLAPAAIERPDLGASRRLGVGMVAGETSPDDPKVEGGVALVATVVPHSPADGKLVVGDRIVAVGGVPLDRKDAMSDLSRRTHGDELPEDTTVTVLRGHREIDVAVHIPKVPGARERFGRSIGTLREISSQHLVVAAAMRGVLVIALLLLLLRADGQPISSLGLLRAGALREVLASIWMTAGTFAVQLVVAIPVGIIGMAAGVLQHENEQRTRTLGAIAQQGSVLEFALAAIFATAFEEIAFRGFLLPRTRVLVGGWPLAIVLVSVVFGAGHLYEGPLAIIQTACLGAYFAGLMLLRRRLLGPILAHAAFDTVMIVVIRALVQSNVLERLKSFAPH